MSVKVSCNGAAFCSPLMATVTLALVSWPEVSRTIRPRSYRPLAKVWGLSSPNLAAVTLAVPPPSLLHWFCPAGEIISRYSPRFASEAVPMMAVGSNTSVTVMSSELPGAVMAASGASTSLGSLTPNQSSTVTLLPLASRRVRRRLCLPIAVGVYVAR